MTDAEYHANIQRFRRRHWLHFGVQGLLMGSAALLGRGRVAGPIAINPQLATWPLLLALAGVWAFGAHLCWQLARLDTTDPNRCLTLFRSNRDAGVILALFLAAAAAA